jgi:hypothetical protein
MLAWAFLIALEELRWLEGTAIHGNKVDVVSGIDTTDRLLSTYWVLPP